MSTPVKEYPPTLPTTQDGSLRSSDDDKTFQGEESVKSSAAKPNLKPVDTAHEGQQPLRSPSMNREQASRLDDDLEVARIEQAVSEANEDEQALAKTTTRRRERRVEVADEFDIATNPVHEKNKKYAPPENPSTKVARIFKRVHRSTFLVRYFFYITPVVALILVPLLLGLLVFPRATVGGVRLFWFSIWLEIVWLTLWAGRVRARSSLVTIGLPRPPLSFPLTCAPLRRSSPSVYPTPSASSPACSPTTARNGGIWVSSSRFRPPSSCGGWRSRSPSCRPCEIII